VPKLVCPICGRSRPTSRGKNKVSDEFTPKGLLRHIRFCHPDFYIKFLKSKILEILSIKEATYFMDLWRELGYPDKGILWRCLMELVEEGRILMIKPKNGYYTRATIFMYNS